MDTEHCPLAFGPNTEHRCEWDGKPLTGRQRRWCSTRCQDELARNHYWTNARAAAVERDGGECVVCGDPFLLQVHHDPPAPDYGPGCHHHLDKLTTLCRAHHNEAHRVMRASKAEVQLALGLVPAGRAA